MTASMIIVILSLLVTCIGVFFLIFAYFEYSRLKELQQDIKKQVSLIDEKNFLIQQVSHKIIASYNAKDIDMKISLLKEAEHIYPDAYNLYNALGYAFMEKGQIDVAIDYFYKAIGKHPEDIAGYCDLAFAYHKSGKKELEREYIQKAKEINPDVRLWW